jgi:hypothetical protein
VPEMLKIRHSTGKGTAGSFGGIWYLIIGKTKAKNFNYFSQELNV